LEGPEKGMADYIWRNESNDEAITWAGKIAGWVYAAR